MLFWLSHCSFGSGGFTAVVARVSSRIVVSGLPGLALVASRLATSSVGSVTVFSKPARSIASCDSSESWPLTVLGKLYSFHEAPFLLTRVGVTFLS